jgi:Tol biopolymer transport system component
MPAELAKRWLAFARGPEGVSSDIYISRADLDDLVQLTHGPGFRYNPAWSPDRTRILYRVEGPEGAPIDLKRDGTWMVNVDGGGDHSVTAISGLAGGGVSQPWSPDGNRILMAASKGGPTQIWVMRSNGTEAKALTPDDYEAQYPAWSPDGSRIAFAVSKDDAFRIYVMKADGSDPKPITDGPMDNWPSWSPDGAHIVFGRGGGLAQMRADGSEIKDLVPEEIGGVPATWAPGSLVAFNCSLGGGRIGICVKGTDGGLTALLLGADAGFPSWKP